MATVKEITTMCKSGNISAAYEQAKSDLNANPLGVWEQRGLGWTLYYIIKSDVEQNNYDALLAHLDELNNLEQLTVANDSLIFDNVIFKIGEFIKNCIDLDDVDSPVKLSAIFSRLKNYTFNPSRGYSFLLQGFLKFESWGELADFFDWWNLDNLSQEDYTPFVTQNGRQIMALAERAFIAYSKALLRLNDTARIEEFLPRMDALMDSHPEMTYPGYFYGKLLMALGGDKDEALKVLVPFARRKATEFWVWQLISDVYSSEPEMQRACLLRSVNSRTKEAFLGKVRIKLANLYIQLGQYDKARFHIDAVTRCYASNGWRLPNEIDLWMRQPWINFATPDGTDSLDYMTLTNQILCNGSEEAVAIVTYVDPNSHRASLIYGNKKRMGQKLRFKVNPGDVLKINFINDSDGKAKVINASKISLPLNLDYSMFAEGVVDKREDKQFAFVKVGQNRCFMSPSVVQKFNVCNGESIKTLIVYDYDKKKETWNWVCLTIKRN